MYQLNNRSDLRDFIAEFGKHINEFGNGLKFKTGRITYEVDGSGASFKVTVAPEATGFRDIHRENLEFTSMEYGQEFVSRFEKFRVVGYNPRAKRYPVIAERVSDGKRFKFTRLAVEDK